MLGNLTTGTLFRNRRPHVRSVHAYFPSVAVLPDGEMVAIYVLGEAFEATNLRTHVARSLDGGQTWQDKGMLYPGTSDRLTTDCGRLALGPDGELVANLIRHDRTAHPEEGFTNPKNLGFVPTELLLTRSADRGHTWSPPEQIEPPLVGPEFEMCSPLTILRDGRWLWPTSTWRDWAGDLPNGNRMVALVSEDRGKTWPRYLDVMTSPQDNLIFWESKIIEPEPGCLVAVAWCYDEAAGGDRPNQYAISHDGGQTWSPPASTGLSGQTMTPFALDGGRILSVYRRMDKPGLWANLSRLEGDRWINEACRPLWGDEGPEGITPGKADMVERFQTLRFGAPCITRLPDGGIYVAFWCYEECIGIIRWFKFHIDACT